MKITMDKKWARRGLPDKQVRILCTDSGHEDYPVVYIDEKGNPRTTTPEGKADKYFDEPTKSDLVPLQEKVADVWLVFRNDGTPIHEVFSTADASNEWIEKWGLPHYKPYRGVRMTQAEEKS